MIQKGLSPLWRAAFDGRKDIVQLLLDSHANVNLPNDVRYSNTMYIMHIDINFVLGIHS